MPLSDGGTRQGLEPAKKEVTRKVRVRETETETETKTEPESEPDDEGFFLKYRMWLVAGGGGLLILAYVASKTSKKGR